MKIPLQETRRVAKIETFKSAKVSVPWVFVFQGNKVKHLDRNKVHSPQVTNLPGPGNQELMTSLDTC